MRYPCTRNERHEPLSALSHDLRGTLYESDKSDNIIIGAKLIVEARKDLFEYDRHGRARVPQLQEVSQLLLYRGTSPIGKRPPP